MISWPFSIFARPMIRQDAHTTGPPFFSALSKESSIFGLRWEDAMFVNVFGT